MSQARAYRPVPCGVRGRVSAFGYFSGRDEPGDLVLASGDIEVVREYILSYGAWTPLISATLMALQAILALLPSYIPDFANGLPSAAFEGGLLSLVRGALAAAISFEIAHALARCRSRWWSVSRASAVPTAGSPGTGCTRC